MTDKIEAICKSYYEINSNIFFTLKWKKASINSQVNNILTLDRFAFLDFL